jgi:Transcription initiation factor IIE, alpha subunit
MIGEVFMKVFTYMCENCLEPFEFDSSEDNDFLCPKCGEKMMYWGTQEVDPNTNKVIKDYIEVERKQANPGKPLVQKQTITCPFCKSTNIRKIGMGERAVSVLGLGLLSKKFNKSFKCNSCGGTF